MAGLPWFELDTDYHDSPKVEALKSRLRNPEADAFPSRLYAYCYKHALDRFDPEVAQHVIEAAAKWRGRRGVLFDALFAVGVLERDAGKVVVHGVEERLAPHLAKREADRIRISEKRDKAATALRQRSDVAQESRRHRGDVAGNRDRNRDKETPDQGETPLAPRPVTPLVAFLRETYPDIRDPWKVEAAWIKAYPGVDLLVEAIKARAWEVSAPKNSRKDHGSFLNNWFKNATPAPPPAPKPPPLPTLDAAWLGALPAEVRPTAEEAWREMAEDVARASYPDARPRLVAEARDHFQATWRATA
jgi:hypothetical protein